MSKKPEGLIFGRVVVGVLSAAGMLGIAQEASAASQHNIVDETPITDAMLLKLRAEVGTEGKPQLDEGSNYNPGLDALLAHGSSGELEEEVTPEVINSCPISLSNTGEDGGVSPCDTSCYTDLGDAVAAANLIEGPQTITLYSPTYTAHDMAFTDRYTTTIQSADPEHSPIVNAQYAGQIGQLSQGAIVELKNIIFTGGNNKNSGGGFSVEENSTLLVDGSTVTENTGLSGGAFFVDHSTLIIRNSEIINNIAKGVNGFVGAGGAIYANDSVVNLFEVTIEGNEASDGGDGGGIFVRNTGSGPGGEAQVKLKGLIVTNNIAGDGGGLAVVGAHVEVEKSQIYGNELNGQGNNLGPNLAAVDYSRVDVSGPDAAANDISDRFVSGDSTYKFTATPVNTIYKTFFPVIVVNK